MAHLTGLDIFLYLGGDGLADRRDFKQRRDAAIVVYISNILRQIRDSVCRPVVSAGAKLGVGIVFANFSQKAKVAHYLGDVRVFYRCQPIITGQPGS